MINSGCKSPCIILQQEGILIQQRVNKMKTRNSVNQLNTSKYPQRRLALNQVFRDQMSLGWELLDAESLIYSQVELTIDKITHLTSLYSSVIQKLNGIKDPRESYFSHKMQKLMAEPFIIRCFTNQQDHKKSLLQNRRKELQIKIEKEAERQNHRIIVEQTIQAQKEKQKRVRNKIRDTVDQADKRLQSRIERRKAMRLQRSMQMSPSSSLGSSADLNQQGKLNSTDFQLTIDQQQSHRKLRRQISHEQHEQQQTHRLMREMRLWQKKG